MTDTYGQKQSFTQRLVRALKPKPSGDRLRKKSWAGPEARKISVDSSQGQSFGRRSMGTRSQQSTDYSYNDNVDEQTGERRDDTELLHSLAHTGSFDTLDNPFKEFRFHSDAPKGDELFAKLPDKVWNYFVAYLPLSDAANLTLSCKPLRNRLGPETLSVLNLPNNRDEKIAFLVSQDSSLPDHIFCFQCATYHRRTRKGSEKLKAANILNPLFNCPWANEPTELPLRTKLVPGHRLPFAFIQLALRHERYGPAYGISVKSLDRRWKDTQSGWSHQIRYYYHHDHLLMRSTSKSFAAGGISQSAQRNLLYSREDYFPYFSVCAHWRDGELMNNCKCALGHIPIPRESISQQLQKGPGVKLSLRPANTIVSLCKDCRPMRRCPECPTEYLIEVKYEEDRTDPHPTSRFKHALSVTRWSDLGDGSTPLSLEWAACNGTAEEYDSFAHIGKRGISGIFESQSGVTLPGQRMLSLNPKNDKLGEEGHNWY